MTAVETGNTLNERGQLVVEGGRPPTTEEVYALVTALGEKVDEQIRLLNIIVDNIRPVLDSMAASPIGRMFGLEQNA